MREGCEEETGFMAKMRVWDRVTRGQAQMDPDGTDGGYEMDVCAKKGDKVRCRLVAQELAEK